MPAIDHLFIAEKPSLAEGIALARAEQLGVKAEKQSADACWVVGPDRVTWLYGHMYDTAEPGQYGDQWKSRSVATLPITVPFDKWKLVIAEDRRPAAGDNRPTLDKRAHIQKINALLGSAQNIVNCGDAAREGQLLVDEVILEAGVDAFGSNVRRLWVKSLARKDMLAALTAMKPNAEKRSLYNSAICRQRADWLHGMNFSRLYTGLARNSGVDANIQIGRVMTPTLRLVVDRDRERINFKEVRHFLPKIIFAHENGSFAANWVIPNESEGTDLEGRLVDKTVADGICQKVAGKPGRISAFKTELKSKGAPLPFSLSALQAECGAKLHLTADETLNVAQALYERHKATTYPRSDSRHLPTAILKDEAPSIMRALGQTDEYGAITDRANMDVKSVAWDDSKVSDHHAIIPTTEFSAMKLAQMSPVERQVFDIIAKSFIAQFHLSFKWKATSVDVTCEGERFKANGRIITDQGWKVVYGAEEEEEEDDEGAQSVPTMAQGDAVKATSGEVTAKATPKPPEFTDGTLITAMVAAHKFETNPELKKRLKEGDGIGTEATRAATIQKLLRSKMLERKGKDKLVSTDFGRSIIDMLPEDLRSLGMTALWEGLLSQVEKGNVEPEAFLERHSKAIADHIERSRGRKVAISGMGPAVPPLAGDGKPCSKCGQGIMRTKQIRTKDVRTQTLLSCDSWPKCQNSEWPERKVTKLLPGEGKPCSKCRDGIMQTREYKDKKDGSTKQFLACSKRPACDGVIWPERRAA